MTPEKVERRPGKGGDSDEMTPAKESNSGADGSTRADRICYTIDQVAADIGCTRPTVYALIRAGKLRSFKVGRLRRIPAADVHALVGWTTDAA